MRTMLALAFATLVVACQSDARGAAHLQQVAEPHFADFDRFDGWARRTISTSVVRDQDALEEALFAPVRRDRDVVAIWVTRTRVDELALSRGRAPKPTPRWETVRDPLLGTLRVAEGEVREQRVVLIARERDAGPSKVEVIVAYARADP